MQVATPVGQSTTPYSIGGIAVEDGATAPYLDLTPKLSFRGGAPHGRYVQLTLKPTCGRGTITTVRPSSGRAFQRAVDPATGEIARVWQIERKALRALARRVFEPKLSEVLEETPDLTVVEARRWVRFQRDLVREQREAQEAENALRAEVEHARRAAGNVRDYCRHNRISHLWTLTFRVACRSRQQAGHCWRRFRQRLSAEGYAHIPMVGVLEPHPGGHGWHVHFGTSQFLPVKVIRSAWQMGNVNVQGPRKGRGPRACARYISKYVSKSLSDLECQTLGVDTRRPGEHRYYVAQGTSPEVERYGANDRRALWSLALNLMGPPVSMWCSDALTEWNRPRVWVLDWWKDDRSVVNLKKGQVLSEAG